MTGRPDRTRRALYRLCRLLLASTCVLGAPSHALDRDLALRQFYHSSWSVKDGAPLSTWELEETTDGWIWLGGRRGLYRFDGLQFERFEPPAGSPFPSASVAQLRAAPNGDLWVVFQGGGLSRIRGNEVTHYGSADGLPTRPMHTLMIGLDGTVWGISRSALWRFDGRRWARVEQEWGLAPGDKAVAGLLMDAQGTLWFGEDGGVWALRRGALRFERVAADPKGDSWQTIDGRAWMLAGRTLSAMPELDAAAPHSSSRWIGRRHSAILVDRQHNLWSAYCEAGLCRTRVPQPLAGMEALLPGVEERFDRRDGLSGDIVSNLIEDRTGSLWVATQTGLDRFRRSLAVKVETPGGFAQALVPGADGSVLVLGAGSSTFRAPRRWRVDRGAELLPADDMLARSVHRDLRGRLWVAGAAGLAPADNRQALIAWPDTAARDRRISIASDANGLWVAAEGAPLLRHEHGSTGFTVPVEVELTKEPPRSVTVEANGRAWFGFSDERVVSRLNGELHTYRATDGLNVGPIGHVHAGRAVIAAGDRGVALWQGARFHPIVADDPEVFAFVSGILETADGNVWFNGLKGIVRVAASELALQASDPAHRLRYRLLDEFDGISGSARGSNANVGAAIGADGRLWFITAPGDVVWVDPARLAEPVPPPMPVLRGIHAAGVLQRPAEGIVLPELTHSVSLSYTALGADIPERVRFRYRLEGLEADWTDGGHRREVSYANLGPGQYVFHVQARSGDGGWSAEPATLSFAIRPAFYQTGSFKALCVAAVLLLLWPLYLLRVRQVESRARRQMRVRMNERESIARDLHDTLLQGVTALTLHVRAAINRAGPDSPVRERLEHALKRAGEIMVEGRDRVVALRRTHLQAEELTQRLSAAADDMTHNLEGPQHTFTIEGTPRPLHAAAADEIYWIAREALTNACQHAHAREVRLVLRFGARSLELEVSDDGTGFDTEAVGRSGHFGLEGMRERAARIESRLEVRSSAAGSTLTLKVAAAVIYADRLRARADRSVL